ncbi:hypothetical protein [Actinokineospora fastidiosa]|uniref:Uncharacterized protein n=1 Tax=Actinokineospora fastidiosa TaxID=1816 RepID=A0A918GSB6_9PSEU|nr:hypothetical protein [Actinokineospora fastidiosa]GGS54963.1 hypothetical protein GCM10010171_57640 [Actinokineospora fastidiosa]
MDQPEHVNRRQLLFGVTGLAVLAAVGVGVPAQAVAIPPIRDTFQGLLVFLVPGRDRFSAHQGRTADGPSGAETGAAGPLQRTYDQAVPIPLVGRPFDLNLPGAAAVAAILNLTALDVDARAALGPFASAFANLSFEGKAEVFRRLERPGMADGTPARFLINTIPTLAAFAAYSEAPVFRRGELVATPVGWRLSDYDGVSDGWPEFLGYYRGVDRVRD